MTKKILLLFCIPTFVCAMDRPHLDLNLVINNNEEDNRNCFPTNKLWGHNPQPPRNNITTMSAEPHINKNDANHIIGNVCTYSFKADSINSVYMQEPPTSDLTRAIKNVAPGMRPGAMIEIELHPCLEIPCDLKKSLIEHNWPLFNDTEKDPFTAVIDVNIFFTAFDIMFNGIEIAKQHKAQINVPVSPTFMKNAATLSKTIEELLTFYKQQGVGKKKLLKQQLLEEICFLQKYSQTPQIIFFFHGPKSGPEKFLSAKNLDTRDIPVTPDADIQTFIKNLFSKDLFSKGIGTMPDGRHAYTEDMFLAESFANFILCDAFVTLTQNNMKDCMLTNGFIFPTIERKTSSYNGRNNVWIIRAFKAFPHQKEIAMLISLILQYANSINKTV